MATYQYSFRFVCTIFSDSGYKINSQRSTPHNRLHNHQRSLDAAPLLAQCFFFKLICKYRKQRSSYTPKPQFASAVKTTPHTAYRQWLVCLLSKFWSGQLLLSLKLSLHVCKLPLFRALTLFLALSVALLARELCNGLLFELCVLSSRLATPFSRLCSSISLLPFTGRGGSATLSGSLLGRYGLADLAWPASILSRCRRLSLYALHSRLLQLHESLHRPGQRLMLHANVALSILSYGCFRVVSKALEVQSTAALVYTHTSAHKTLANLHVPRHKFCMHTLASIFSPPSTHFRLFQVRSSCIPLTPTTRLTSTHGPSFKQPIN